MDGGIGEAVLAGKGGSILLVEVQPGSRRPGMLSYDPWRRRIRLTVGEKAEKGKANAEVLAALASVLCVSARSVRIAAGLTGRLKSVEVLGLGPSEALQRIAPHMKGD